MDVARHPHRDGGGRRRAVGGRLGCLNAALIVNPATGILVASGRDTTRGWRVEGGAPDARVGHPLRHAVFEAVDAAAARDLEVHGPDAPPPTPTPTRRRLARSDDAKINHARDRV